MAKKQSALVPAGMLLVSLILANKAARAQGSVELMCRNKAKEVAMQTYQGCVTEEKAARLKDLKDRYQSRMSEMKNEFQQELDDLNGKKAAAKPKAQAAKAKAKPARIRAEKPAAGVATALPSKQNDNGPALPVQMESEEQPVITIVNTPSEEAAPETEVVGLSEQ